MDQIVINLKEIITQQLAWLILRGFSIQIPWNNMNSFIWDDRETLIGKTIYLDGENFALGLKIKSIGHLNPDNLIHITFNVVGFNIPPDRDP